MSVQEWGHNGCPGGGGDVVTVVRSGGGGGDVVTVVWSGGGRGCGGGSGGGDGGWNATILVPTWLGPARPELVSSPVPARPGLVWPSSARFGREA